MKILLDYLENPLKVGVYYAQLIADFSNLKKTIENTIKNTNRTTPQSSQLIQIAEEMEEEEKYFELECSKIKDVINKIISFLYFQKACPRIVSEYVGATATQKHIMAIADYIPEKFIISYSNTMEESLTPLESHIIEEAKDVIVIEMDKIDHTNEVLFQLTAIKKDSITKVVKFIEWIPHIGKTVKQLRIKKTYSSRYVFNPYPLAVDFWLKNEASMTTPNDLKELLNGSVSYYTKKDWRTSIVLAAIAVENVLADLYEEKHQATAPNVPLGELYNRVKEKIEFPNEIMQSIEKVNKARISAVHRSRFPVSDREATGAIYGSTTLIIWYSSNY